MSPRRPVGAGQLQNLLLAFLLAFSTTAILAEETAPNQIVQTENDQFAPDKANSIRIRLTDGLLGNLVLGLHRDVSSKFRLGVQGVRLLYLIMSSENFGILQIQQSI
jgi:hypothetical protein